MLQNDVIMENDNSSQVGDDMDFTSTFPFVKALMTGLAVGIADTLLCLAYNLLFRDDVSRGFFSSDIINVSSIIFGVNLLFVVIGVLYSGFLKAQATGEILFSVLFTVLTIIGVIVAMHVHRSADPIQNSRFHGLLTGVILILVISAAAGMHLFYHNRKFGEHIL
jgi:hypothetical protein